MNKILLLLPFLLLFACKGDMDDVEPVKTPIDITVADWRVIQVKNGERVSDPAARYILKLDSDGTFSIRLDVNNCLGDYDINLLDKRISFDSIACTLACCDSEAADDVAEVLEKVTRYDIAAAPGDVPLIFWAGTDYINFTQN